MKSKKQRLRSENWQLNNFCNLLFSDGWEMSDLCLYPIPMWLWNIAWISLAGPTDSKIIENDKSVQVKETCIIFFFFFFFFLFFFFFFFFASSADRRRCFGRRGAFFVDSWRRQRSVSSCGIPRRRGRRRRRTRGRNNFV